MKAWNNRETKPATVAPINAEITAAATAIISPALRQLLYAGAEDYALELLSEGRISSEKRVKPDRFCNDCAKEWRTA